MYSKSPSAIPLACACLFCMPLDLGACCCRSDLQEQQAPGTGSRTCIRGSSHTFQVPRFSSGVRTSRGGQSAPAKWVGILPWPTDPLTHIPPTFWHPASWAGGLAQARAARHNRAMRRGFPFFLLFFFLAVPMLTRYSVQSPGTSTKLKREPWAGRCHASCTYGARQQRASNTWR